MSLPDPAVINLLRHKFELVWRNIRREEYVGDSFGYSARQTCVGTTNGAGGRNVQLFVLAPDEAVLHALPGFWHPEDLARELRFGLQAWQLWRDTGRTLEQKRDMYRRMVLTELNYHAPETYARSDWQAFDKLREASRGPSARDTFEKAPDGSPRRSRSGALVLKPTNVLTHQRMAARAFLPFDDFDIEAFVDYGNRFYDNNRAVSGKGKRLK